MPLSLSILLVHDSDLPVALVVMETRVSCKSVQKEQFLAYQQLEYFLSHLWIYLRYETYFFIPSSASLGAAGGSSGDMRGVHSSLLPPSSPSPSMADGSGLRGRSGLDERSEGRGSISWVYTSVRTS